MHQSQSTWIGTGSVYLEIKTDRLENLNFRFTSIVVSWFVCDVLTSHLSSSLIFISI